MNQIISGKLVSGEFFVGELEKTSSDETVYSIKNMMCILMQQTDQEGKIQLGIAPLNPFGKKDEIIDISINNILFMLNEIPDVIINQYNMMTSNIVIPKPKIN